MVSVTIRRSQPPSWRVRPISGASVVLHPADHLGHAADVATKDASGRPIEAAERPGSATDYANADPQHYSASSPARSSGRSLLRRGLLARMLHEAWRWVADSSHSAEDVRDFGSRGPRTLCHRRGKPGPCSLRRGEGLSERYVETRRSGHGSGSPAGRRASCNIRARSSGRSLLRRGLLARVAIRRRAVRKGRVWLSVRST